MYVMARLSNTQTSKIERFEREQNLKVFVLEDLDLRPALIDPDKQLALKHLEKHLGKHIVALDPDDLI